jgi:hypothetical protein
LFSPYHQPKSPKPLVGFLQASPVLRQEIEVVTQHEVRLRGNVVLSTRAGNYRTVRGRTLLEAIMDEVAFLRDETSSMPDVETYRALLPALATTGGMLIGISTPIAGSACCIRSTVTTSALMILTSSSSLAHHSSLIPHSTVR